MISNTSTFTSTLSDSDEEPSWYAVYTKSRHEKVAENYLRRRGVTTFLPLREVESQWKDRKKLIQTPLFPSYVFVNITENEIYDVMYARGVLRLVGFSGDPVPIPAEQIDSVKTLIKSKLKYDPYPYLEKGKEVIIKKGPLQGVIGKIVDKNSSSKHTLIISIQLIKRAVSVEMDVSNIEPL